MLRVIGGVVVGYLVIVVFIMATLSIAYVVMGADAAYQPGTFMISMLWIVVTFVLSLVGAIAGGFVCAAIGKNPKSVPTLATLVVVLGILFAIPVLMFDDPRPIERTGDVGLLEAMQGSHQPVWVALANPVVGAVGTLIGGGLKKRD